LESVCSDPPLRIHLAEVVAAERARAHHPVTAVGTDHAHVHADVRRALLAVELRWLAEVWPQARMRLDDALGHADVRLDRRLHSLIAISIAITRVAVSLAIAVAIAGIAVSIARITVARITVAIAVSGSRLRRGRLQRVAVVLRPPSAPPSGGSNAGLASWQPNSARATPIAPDRFR
jgi:hypothetical protein